MLYVICLALLVFSESFMLWFLWNLFRDERRKLRTRRLSTFSLPPVSPPHRPFPPQKAT